MSHFSLGAAVAEIARKTVRASSLVENLNSRLRNYQGLPMRGIQRDDSPLLRAAQSYWGSWHAALLAAGINEPTQQWDRHRIVAAMKANP
jgi:hypothetical protein